MKGQLVELYKIWGQMQKKAWANKSFKEKLLNNPKETFNEFGIDLDDKKIQIHDYSKDDVIHLSLNSPPTVVELSEKELEKVAGAGCICHGCGGIHPNKH